jgi:hypothetical protein
MASPGGRPSPPLGEQGGAGFLFFFSPFLSIGSQQRLEEIVQRNLFREIDRILARLQ